MGNRIKLRRKELHFKQADLAELLEISNNHMSAIERGREKPSLDTFISICQALKVTPDYLLLGNMHAFNIPQDIIDKLYLCSQEDIQLAKQREIAKNILSTVHTYFSQFFQQPFLTFFCLFIRILPVVAFLWYNFYNDFMESVVQKCVFIFATMSL